MYSLLIWRSHQAGVVEFFLLIHINKEDRLPRVNKEDKLPIVDEEDKLFVMPKLAMHVPKLILYFLVH